MGALTKGLRPGLYAITDSALTPEKTLVASVEAALRGGAVMIQYREKRAPLPERIHQARALKAACQNAGALLIINDDPELALRVRADGIHLGQNDRSLAETRRMLGERAVIGITCHADLRLAEAARDAGADYLAFGRFFPSSTKPEASSADASVLTEAKQFRRPVTAIGGVTTDNGGSLIHAGADMLAVVGGLFGGCPADVEQRARSFTHLFELYHPFFSLSNQQENRP